MRMRNIATIGIVGVSASWGGAIISFMESSRPVLTWLGGFFGVLIGMASFVTLITKSFRDARMERRNAKLDAAKLAEIQAKTKYFRDHAPPSE
jgi:hypothetical protein